MAINNRRSKPGNKPKPKPVTQPLTLESLAQKMDQIYADVNKRLDDIVARLEEVKNSACVEAKEAVLTEVRKVQDSVPTMFKEEFDSLQDYQQRLVKLEAHGRRLNLIIGGQQESAPVLNEDGHEIPEDVDTIVRNIFTSQMGLDATTVSNFLFRDAHRLGKKSVIRVKPRPIIVAFILQKDRNLVMSSAHKFKGTALTIRSDLPKELAEKRDNFLIERKRLVGSGVSARVVERGYMPVLEVKRGRSWVRWSEQMDPHHV